MKQVIWYITLLFVTFLSACEEKYDMYSEPDNRLNIISDTLISYTFTVKPAEVVLDTVWVRVQTMGLISDKDRVVKFEQVPVDTLNALPGIHYVAFDDPQVRDLYQVPAHRNYVDLPILVKRDISLKSETVNLKIRLVDGPDFKVGYADRSETLITISDMLEKPTLWTNYAIQYFLGAYGPVKHQFMIDVTGESIDDDWFRALGLHNGTSELAYLMYLGTWFSDKLDERNAERAAAGLEPLREAPLEGQAVGTLVKFVRY